MNMNELFEDATEHTTNDSIFEENSEIISKETQKKILEEITRTKEKFRYIWKDVKYPG